MSGGSAFYVLIYAVFYFVNKVFLLGESAMFLGVTVGFGKGNGGPAESHSTHASTQGSADSPSRQDRWVCPRTCAEQHSLTPPERGISLQLDKNEIFLPLPELPLQRALVGLSPLCVTLLIFFFPLFCFSWILLSLFPPYCTLATLPSWSCPSGS